jgi:hypothetical protein
VQYFDVMFEVSRLALQIHPAQEQFDVRAMVQHPHKLGHSLTMHGGQADEHDAF